MGLKDIGEALPPGFRFYPSDEELVCHYLYNKIANQQPLKGTLVEIDLHTCEPWQLPEVAKLNGSEWYFFSFRDRKYATGYRTNRATNCGYWKATGKDRIILDPNTRQVVGMRKTLVFYRNRAPNGIKTGWIMHEFRLETPHMPPKEDWVLCRVFHKSRAAGEIITTNLMTSITPTTMTTSNHNPFAFDIISLPTAPTTGASFSSNPPPPPSPLPCSYQQNRILTQPAGQPVDNASQNQNQNQNPNRELDQLALLNSSNVIRDLLDEDDDDYCFSDTMMMINSTKNQVDDRGFADVRMFSQEENFGVNLL